MVNKLERTISFLKNLKADVIGSVEDEYSTSITVDSNDLKHINQALEDIENLKREVSFWKDHANCKAIIQHSVKTPTTPIQLKRMF